MVGLEYPCIRTVKNYLFIVNGSYNQTRTEVDNVHGYRKSGVISIMIVADIKILR